MESFPDYDFLTEHGLKSACRVLDIGGITGAVAVRP